MSFLITHLKSIELAFRWKCNLSLEAVSPSYNASLPSFLPLGFWLAAHPKEFPHSFDYNMAFKTFFLIHTVKNNHLYHDWIYVLIYAHVEMHIHICAYIYTYKIEAKFHWVIPYYIQLTLTCNTPYHSLFSSLPSACTDNTNSYIY